MIRYILSGFGRCIQSAALRPVLYSRTRITPLNVLRLLGLIFILSLCLGLVISPFCKEEWKEKRCRHFSIFYKDAPPDFVGNVEEAAERYYEEIVSNLGFKSYRLWSSGEQAKIYIYNDQKDYVVSANQADWSQGAAYFQSRTIWTFPAAHGFFDSTLPHELGHIIFREFVGPKAAVPLWFDEGVAMFQEKAKRWGAHRVVKKAIEDKRFISLAELSKLRTLDNLDQARIDLFYAESASVVYFMIKELGEHRFLEFCRNIKTNQDFARALKSAYRRFNNVPDLEQAWINYLESN